MHASVASPPAVSQPRRTTRESYARPEPGVNRPTSLETIQLGRRLRQRRPGSTALARFAVRCVGVGGDQPGLRRRRLEVVPPYFRSAQGEAGVFIGLVATDARDELRESRPAQGSSAAFAGESRSVVRGSREPSGGCAAGPLRMARDRLPPVARTMVRRRATHRTERSLCGQLNGADRLSRCPGRVVRPSRPCAGPSCSRPVVLAARSRRRPWGVSGRCSSDTGAR
jgi:hypothetical protein